eukprot:6459800-Amphidinium_carterae.3
MHENVGLNHSHWRWWHRRRRTGKHNPALYHHNTVSGELDGVLSFHVDDIKLAADSEISKAFIDTLSSRFGALKVQEPEFERCCLMHVLQEDGTVEIHQNHHLDTVVTAPETTFEEPKPLVQRAAFEGAARMQKGQKCHMCNQTYFFSGLPNDAHQCGSPKDLDAAGDQRPGNLQAPGNGICPQADWRE